MTERLRYWVVIPAAGVGTRFGADRPKQYISINNKTILEHTIDCFIERSDIAGIVVAISANDDYWPELAIASDSRITIAPGGEERFHSVRNALQVVAEVADSDDWVMVHDAARPCLQQSAIDRLMSELEDHAVGGILGVPCRDTMKRVNKHAEIVQTVEREHLWHAQTPQMFRLKTLILALDKVIDQKLQVTDEAMAIELQGLLPKIVEGHHENIKITHKDDLKHAETYLS